MHIDQKLIGVNVLVRRTHRIPRATKETSVQNLIKTVVERRGNESVDIVALQIKDTILSVAILSATESCKDHWARNAVQLLAAYRIN